MSSPPGKTTPFLFFFFFFNTFIPMKAQAGASLCPGQAPRPCLGASHAPPPAWGSRSFLLLSSLLPAAAVVAEQTSEQSAAALPARAREALGGHSISHPEQTMAGCTASYCKRFQLLPNALPALLYTHSLPSLGRWVNLSRKRHGLPAGRTSCQQEGAEQRRGCERRAPV